MKRPLAISLSPNLESQDVMLAIKQFLFIWEYQRGNSIKQLEQWFRDYFKVSHAISFNSGRTALFAILKSLGIGKGDEVLLQSFTCVAVPNSVIWAQAIPVYIDINKNFQLDLADIKKKITGKTKAIILQHTFGIPCINKELLEFLKEQKIKVIEDCAHVIGGEFDNQKLGCIGDAAFYSFGRDKAFSSVFGGMAITTDKTLGIEIRKFQRQFSYPSFFWIMQQLFHPISFSFILPFYDTLSLGKVVLFIFQKIKFLSFPVTKEEKHSIVNGIFVKKMPNALASLAFSQVKRIDIFNKRRKDYGQMYINSLQTSGVTIPCIDEAIFLRFPIIVQNKQKLFTFLKKKGILIGTWYSETIDPKGVDYKKIQYEIGSCPQAEQLAKNILNLPTYPTMLRQDVEKVVELIKQYDNNSGSNR